MARKVESGYGKVNVLGLAEFRRYVRQATEDGTGEEALKEANYRVGLQVIRWAQREAAGDAQRAQAADTLTSTRRGYGVYVTGGDRTTPWFGGANFGADRDIRRLVKAPKQGKRSRATRVRNEEDIEKVVRRVEAQFVDRRGRTMTQREGGKRVRLARTKSGSVRVIRGWNQFDKWTKGKDYFLYRGIAKHSDDLERIYLDEMEQALRQVFPD